MIVIGSVQIPFAPISTSQVDFRIAWRVRFGRIRFDLVARRMHQTGKHLVDIIITHQIYTHPFTRVILIERVIIKFIVFKN